MSKNDIYKTIFIGDSNVGKTSIIKKYVDGSDMNFPPSTVGAAFFPIKKFSPKTNRKIILSVWDTAGQERYQSMTRLYLRDIFLCVYVFDITDEQTFDNIIKWKVLVDNDNDNDQPIINILVANKIDRIDLQNTNGIVSPTKIAKFCQDNDISHYITTSGLTGKGINNLFDKLIECVENSISKTQENLPHQNIITLNENNKKFGSTSCSC